MGKYNLGLTSDNIDSAIEEVQSKFTDDASYKFEIYLKTENACGMDIYRDHGRGKVGATLMFCEIKRDGEGFCLGYRFGARPDIEMLSKILVTGVTIMMFGTAAAAYYYGIYYMIILAAAVELAAILCTKYLNRIDKNDIEDMKKRISS